MNIKHFILKLKLLYKQFKKILKKMLSIYDEFQIKIYNNTNQFNSIEKSKIIQDQLRAKMTLDMAELAFYTAEYNKHHAKFIENMSKIQMYIEEDQKLLKELESKNIFLIDFNFT